MELSDRMKLYEAIESDRLLIPSLPIMVRIDGKSFHTWTRDCQRPFDEKIQRLFDATTKFLVDETNAVVGYTQSDEISLVLWNFEIPDSQVMFNGRTQKLASVLSSMATARFNELAPNYFPDKSLAFFDCRVWNVPNWNEAVNCLIWRELDATRNSIQSAAYALYSNNQLFKKTTSEMQEMIFQKGINWNDYSPRSKRGAYFKRRLIERFFTTEEIERLPPQHEAHKNPDLKIQRHVIERLDLPPLLKVTNRYEVIFGSAQPEVAEVVETNF